MPPLPAQSSLKFHPPMGYINITSHIKQYKQDGNQEIFDGDRVTGVTNNYSIPSDSNGVNLSLVLLFGPILWVTNMVTTTNPKATII